MNSLSGVPYFAIEIISIILLPPVVTNSIMVAMLTCCSKSLGTEVYCIYIHGSESVLSSAPPLGMNRYRKINSVHKQHLKMDTSFL